MTPAHIHLEKFLLLLLLCATAATAEQRTLELVDGTEIAVEVYPATGDRRLLWLPSEFGLSPRQAATAQALAARGIEVWIPDLHGAWFIPPGRYSLNDVDPGALAGLLEQAVGDGRRTFLMSSGRVTGLALYAARRFQQTSSRPERLRGLVTISPALYLRTPQGGMAAEFLPVAGASNIPIYLLQPQESARFWHLRNVLRELEKGGSPVYLHRLPEVGDGFNLRARFTPTEEAMTARLPGILDHALQHLDTLGGAPAQPPPLQGEELSPQRPEGSALLRPYPGERHAPALRLARLDGAAVDLESLRGQVVLVNFWATWCPPCVEEIPSLQRLYAATRARGLEILAVDVGETPAQMREFLADKPIDFPVLMDVDAEAFRTWGVHAFPTTLVLDRAHRIRYAVFGAFHWDSSEVLQALEPLLQE